MSFLSLEWPSIRMLALLSLAMALGTFRGEAQSLQQTLLIRGEANELGGTTNGAAVAPSVNTAALTGTVVKNGSGSINFVPGQTGNGVYFLNCCDNTNNASYKFTGSNIGEVFSVDQGQITFYLKSRYSFANRQSIAPQARFAFDVHDNNPNNHLFYFLTQPSSGYLLFSYRTGGTGAQFYYVPQGTQDTLFGLNKIIKVTLEWTGTVSRLYLNDTLVQSANYTKSTPSWTSASTFSFGAYDYSPYGAFNGSDDVIDEFSVVGPSIVRDTTPPQVSIAAPSSGSTVSGTVTVSANATDDTAVTSVQFKLNGTNFGTPVSGSGPGFSVQWNTAGFSNSSYTWTATAADAAGNSGTSNPVSVTLFNSLLIDQRVKTTGATQVYATPTFSGTPLGTQVSGALGTVAGGPVTADGVRWWQITYFTGASGWTPETLIVAAPMLGIATNTWLPFTPSYSAAPDGGRLYPQGWSNKGAYDAATGRIIVSDRWYDTVRGSTIFANGIYTIDPAEQAFAILKLNNWRLQAIICDGGAAGCSTTVPLPANTSDPTPPDHHPLTALEVVPTKRAVYAVNGVNSYLQDVSILAATWKLDLTSGNWTKVSAAAADANHPPNNIGSPSGLVYDPPSNRLAYFVPSECGCAGTATYLFNPDTNLWTAVSQDSSSLNVYVAGAGFTYDSRRHLVMAYGGNVHVGGTPTPALWSYSVSQNKWTRLADSPLAAMAPGFSYDSTHDVFVALVGETTLVYDPSTNVWSQLAATLSRPAGIRSWQSVTYSAAHDALVFQGGSQDAPLFALFRYQAGGPLGTPDTTAPVLSVTSPVDGGIVSGSLLLSTTATDNVGVSWFEYEIDGQIESTIVTNSNSVFRLTWDTTTVTNGHHTIKATAHDAAGNSTTRTLSVTVSNGSPPEVSIAAPAAGASVTGNVTISAIATDDLAVTGVQLQLNGADLGGVITGTGPQYLYVWDTTQQANGTYALSAKAFDGAGNVTTSGSITVTVNNAVVPPVISNVSVSGITSTSAAITWVTDKVSDSQVAYGLTTAYGQLSPLNSAQLTSHSVTLGGLAASTTYHVQARSRTAQGGLALSDDFVFTTSAAPVGPQTLLHLRGDATETSGVTNNSVVHPTVGPAGFTGTVVVKGGGSVNYTPAQTGNGVYFLQCCDVSNGAYYHFQGTPVGDIFNVNQGQVSFYLKSRVSFAQRKVSGTQPRLAFDVRDNDSNTHLFYFLTQPSSGYLLFSYRVGGTAAQFYYVPLGTEETLFGLNKVMKVTLTWDGTQSKLFLNDTQVQSSNYAKATPNWTAASNFNLGAYEYANAGAYYHSDDVIDEFIVTGPAAAPDTSAPSVTMTAPAAAATVSGTVTVSATATDDIGVTGVQFLVDGAPVGSPATGAGPSYSFAWSTSGVSNGPHTIAAQASDAAGHVTTSAGRSVTVANDTTLPVISMTAPANGATVSGSVTLSANATDNVGVSSVQFLVDGIGGIL